MWRRVLYPQGRRRRVFEASSQHLEEDDLKDREGVFLTWSRSPSKSFATVGFIADVER
jgi:hypothetical protein